MKPKNDKASEAGGMIMKGKRFFYLALITTFVRPLYSQTQAQQSLQDRVESLERRLTQLEERLANVAVPSGQAATDRVEAIDQKLRILERNRELEQENSKRTAVAGAGEDGFFLRSADKSFQLKAGGYVHADSRWFYDNSSHAGVDSFVLRRVRPVLQGTVFHHLDFRLMPDFAEGKFALQDAYVDVRYFPAAVLRVGKFKGPLGLERLQSANDLLFVERALPTNLVPNRDQGAEIWGDIANINYAVGVFNGATDGGSVDTDVNNGKDVAARVFATPFGKSPGNPLEGFGLGMAVSSGRQESAVLPTFKTSGQATFFSYNNNVLAAGRRLRYSPQAYFYFGPLGLIGEYVQSSQQVAKTATQRPISNHAWQIAGSYFLTGEKNGYKHDSPRHKFEGTNGGSGAWELVARFSELAVDHDAFTRGFADITKSARSAETWSVGVNWYLNRYARMLFDYDQTHFQGGAASGNRETEKAFLNRLQVQF